MRVSGDLESLEYDRDRTLEEIEKLGSVEDVDYTATLVDGTVEFTGVVEAASLTEGQQQFLAAFCAAVPDDRS